MESAAGVASITMFVVVDIRSEISFEHPGLLRLIMHSLRRCSELTKVSTKMQYNQGHVRTRIFTMLSPDRAITCKVGEREGSKSAERHRFPIRATNVSTEIRVSFPLQTPSNLHGFSITTVTPRMAGRMVCREGTMITFLLTKFF
jgi:hypothetical protein